MIAFRRPTLFALISIVVLAGACTTDRPGNGEEGSPGPDRADDRGYSATITRTTGGVPHIVADDLNSVVYGQGWASYEDHACDLADQLVKINGERAKYLGAGDDDDNVSSDFAWKTIDIVGRARADWPDTDPELAAGLDAFAKGWSAAHEAEPTTEWCAGAAWLRPVTGLDIYSYARSVALFASSVQLAQYIGVAHPPTLPPDLPDEATTSTESASGPRGGWPEDLPLASNAWAIGADRSASGGGMLVANPHFPWEGALRFSEVHLTVPGELDIHGAQLSGLPFVGIGVTKDFAWSHTVSAGHRFTIYKLELEPGSPTSYMVDGQPREMTSRDVSVDVLDDAGQTTTQSRTVWSTDDGPVLDFPGVGWSDTTTLVLRDANIDNSQFLDQYMDMDRAKSLDEFIDAHHTHQGVPLFNTVAVGANGDAWYADTSATPNLSPESLAAWENAKKNDTFTKTAADNGAVLLDGSTSRDRWVDTPGARSPGLVPFEKMPMTTRRDYVFNANDSFWVSNANDVLAGDYSPMHGEQQTPISMRSRENAAVLRDISPDGPSGDDEKFDFDELSAAALRNGAGSARFHLGAVRKWCEKAPRDLRDACAVLAGWDERFDLDSVGAVLWREYWSGRPTAEPATPFDPEKPVDTPEPSTESSTIEEGFRSAISTLEKAGVAIDATLRTTQKDGRIEGGGTPVGGGGGAEGVTNVVTNSSQSTTLEPTPDHGEPINPATDLFAGGYRINYGSSFMMIVELGGDEPHVRTLLTYGETADRTSPLFTEQTKRFAEKNWKSVAWTPEEVAAQQIGEPVTVTG